MPSLDLKYRPKTFSDVLGQDKLVKILKRHLSLGDFPSACLLQGPWGGGKTSLARLIAYSLVCMAPVEGESCGKCQPCIDALFGNNPNIEEIDSASNGSVADIRQLILDLRYQPIGESKKRVICLDESHMLTKEAQNALLKIFEEGCLTTHFILATTEPEKVLPTIRSRCFELPLKLIDRDLILERLKFICQQETILFEENGLKLIVAATSGHLRDAIKLLDHIAVMGDITLENVKAYLKYDLNSELLKVLSKVGETVKEGMEELEKLLEKESPMSLSRRLFKVLLGVEKLRLGVSQFETSVENYWGQKLVGQYSTSVPAILDFFIARGLRQTREEILVDFLVFSDKVKTGVFTPKEIVKPVSGQVASTIYEALKQNAFKSSSKSIAKASGELPNASNSVKEMKVEDFVELIGGKIAGSMGGRTADGGR